MSKIPTAEEFLLESISEEDTPRGNIKPNTVISIMIEFAKFHVETALKSASENVELEGDEGSDFMGISVNKDLILNAYPFENIK
jgi:hypothetical protein